MDYAQTIARLEQADISNAFPLFVPSHLRPGHYLYRNIIQYLPKAMKKRVYYIVRKEWYARYKEAQPDVNIIPIHESYEYDGYGTDTTRKFLSDTAAELGYSHILDWDDDIDCLTMAYSAGKTTRRLRKEDQHKYAANMLALASEVSLELFKEHPMLCLGQLGRVSPATCGQDYHKVKAVINGMGLPRMSNIINVKRVAKYGMGHTGDYDMQMEDMGFCASVLGKGGMLFRLPTILHTVPSIEVNPRTEPLVHGDEKELWRSGTEVILRSAIGPYLTYTGANKKYFKTARPVGINWKRWNEEHGQKTITEEW